MTTRSAQLAPSAAVLDWPWLRSATEMAEVASGSWQARPGQPSDDSSPLRKVAVRAPAPTFRAVVSARSFTLRTMQRWGAGDRAADVVAVVSELLTNALRHSLPEYVPLDTPHKPVRLGLVDAGRCVVCAVADPSVKVPVKRPVSWLDETGRGLHVVAALSDDWGYCPAPAELGKVVWAAFATPSRPA